MKYTNIIPAFLVAAITCTGCLKNFIPAGDLSLSPIDAFLKDTTVYDGNFSLDESRSLPGQVNLPFSIRVQGAFTEHATMEKLVLPATVSMNNLPLNQSDYFYERSFDSADGIHGFLGRDVEIKSVNTSNPSHFSNFETTIYYPAPIHIDMPGYIPFIADTNHVIEGSEIYVGQVLKWNADPKNPLGVGIVLEYEPKSTSNPALAKKGFDHPEKNYVYIKDDGEWKVTPELFEDMPHEAAVYLTIIRGNFKYYTLPSDPTKKIRIYCTTTETATFKYNAEGRAD